MHQIEFSDISGFLLVTTEFMGLHNKAFLSESDRSGEWKWERGN